MAQHWHRTFPNWHSFAIYTVNPLLKDLQAQTADRLLAMEVLSCLTETERQMVHLKADGLTCREIAEIFSTTVHGIHGRFRRMRMRLTEMDF